MIYLIVKTHSNTGLKYLCQTTRSDYNQYPGSGVYWKKHLAKHGNDCTTRLLKECNTRDEIIYWGRYYSCLWDVVVSKDWANLIEEEGSGNTSERAKKLWATSRYREKIIEGRKVTYTSPEYRNQQRQNSKNIWKDPVFRKNRPDQSGKNNPRYDSTLHAFVHSDGTSVLMSKWDFAEKYNLRRKAVRHLVAGDVQTHKGWKIEKSINNNG